MSLNGYMRGLKWTRYIVNLFKIGADKIHWHLRNGWQMAIQLSKNMMIVVSHIFKEGNWVRKN